MGEIRIVLFGMGALSKFLTGRIRENIKIVAYLVTGMTGEINGISVISVEQLQDIEYDYIVVAFGNTIRGIEILEEANVPKRKIVGYAYSGLSYEESFLQKECGKLIHEKLCNEKIPELFDIPVKEYFLCGMNEIGRASCRERV